MKTQSFLAIFLLLNYCLFSQVNHRQFNTNYAYIVFEDNFDGTSIDLNKWNPGLIHRGIGELIYSPLTHNVLNGKLDLIMRYSPNYNYNSNYIGAEFSTDSTFLYGIFECEATFANGVGSWPAFWSMHQLPCPDNEGPEIDFAEYSCQSNSNKILGHYIHHWLSAPCGVLGVRASTNNLYENDSSFITSTNQYKSIWTPEKVEYLVDNNLKATHVNNGSDWFPNRPVAVVVSQQITQPNNNSSPVCPQTSSFNYVRVKKFFLSPEISCSSFICASDVAVLDVDTMADSITWSLTPTGLFSGNNTGTGKNATITAAAGASGEGKITYTFKMPSNEIFTAEKLFWVGKPEIAPQTPLAFYTNGVYNSICNLQSYTTNMIVNGATNVTWERITASPSTTTWAQSGNNINFYFWAVNQTAVFRVTATNSCGTTSYDFGFKSVQCGTDPCDIDYLVSPNPSSSGFITIVPNIPAPCDTYLGEPSIQEVSIYDSNETLKKIKKYGEKTTSAEISTSNLFPGIYIVVIDNGTKKVRKRIIVK